MREYKNKIDHLSWKVEHDWHDLFEEVLENDLATDCNELDLIRLATFKALFNCCLSTRYRYWSTINLIQCFDSATSTLGSDLLFLQMFRDKCNNFRGELIANIETDRSTKIIELNEREFIRWKNMVNEVHEYINVDINHIIIV